MKNSRRGRLYRQLLTATLLFGGTFNLVAPAMAAVTTAGTSISNTATGTYEDPSAAGTTINTTSNTVTVTVAEVAGITVTATAATNTRSGASSIQPGDIVNYDFTVTNAGNDPTRFFIPDKALVSGGTQGTIKYSTDGGTTYTNVATNGSTTSSVLANGTVLVRVPVTVSSTAAPNSTVSVQLGNTSTAGDQNVAYAAGPTSNVGDLYTQDNPNSANVQGDPAGAPVNGEREASATQTATVGATPSVQNGPKGAASAAGPTSNADPTGTNSDFTNASTVVGTSLAPGVQFDPDPRTITNTVANPSSNPVTVTLLPATPTVANALPNGTSVKITSGSQTAEYTYNQATGFSPVSGTTTPVRIALTGAAPGNTVDYQVIINLPGSTDQFTAFPVPIRAFNDVNGNGTFDANEPSNITIDNLYTGFVKLEKKSKVLQGTGPAVSAADATLDANNKTPAPGNIVEYDITYTNISSAAPAGGSGNLIMNANQLVITEDGTTAPNNWAASTTNVPSTANASQGSITYFSGNPATTSSTTTDLNLTKYELNITTLTPGTSGTFTIQRQIK